MQDISWSYIQEGSSSDELLNLELGRIEKDYPGHGITFNATVQEDGTSIVESFNVWAEGVEVGQGSPLFTKELERKFVIDVLGDRSKPKTVRLHYDVLETMEDVILSSLPEGKGVSFVAQGQEDGSAMVYGHSVWANVQTIDTGEPEAVFYYRTPFVVFF